MPPIIYNLAEDLYLFTAGTVPATGELRLPFGEERHAPVTASDIASVVVGLLAEPGLHVGERYVVTGPRDLTLAAMAEVLSRELGRPVEYVDVPIKAWGAALRDTAGMPEFLVTHLEAVAKDHQHGLFSAETDVVERIGGRPPESLDSFIRENIAAFGAVAASSQKETDHV